MANYEYNEEDLPEVTPGETRTLRDGVDSTLVSVGSWYMVFIDPPSEEDAESSLEEVEKTILAWIAYRNWLKKNPPTRTSGE